jgi:hypothetical protein
MDTVSISSENPLTIDEVKQEPMETLTTAAEGGEGLTQTSVDTSIDLKEEHSSGNHLYMDVEKASNVSVTTSSSSLPTVTIHLGSGPNKETVVIDRSESSNSTGQDKPITFTMTNANGVKSIVRGNSRMIIEAIDALRARKARPDEDRISHWVHRRCEGPCVY